jgi:hypothetical protein
LGFFEKLPENLLAIASRQLNNNQFQTKIIFKMNFRRLLAEIIIFRRKAACITKSPLPFQRQK